VPTIRRSAKFVGDYIPPKYGGKGILFDNFIVMKSIDVIFLHETILRGYADVLCTEILRIKSVSHHGPRDQVAQVQSEKAS
jgi:hypothetical protein